MIDNVGRELVGSWTNRPPVQAVPTEAQLPDAIQQAAQRYGAEGTVQGVYHDGTVYVVAEHVHTPDDVRKVLLHEIAGQHGLHSH